MTRALLAFAVALAACGDDGEPPPDAGALGVPREIVMAAQPLEPLESAELILTGGAGDVAVITLSSPGPMGWNIHGHAGGGTQIVDEERGVMSLDAYEFRPTSTAGWYLLIRNESGANMEIDVRVELHGDFTWEWQE